MFKIRLYDGKTEIHSTVYVHTHDVFAAIDYAKAHVKDDGYAVIEHLCIDIATVIGEPRTDSHNPEISNIKEAFEDFNDYLDSCGMGELYRSQIGGE